MRTTLRDEDAPFQTVKATSRKTGLSVAWLYAGIKNKTVPHIKHGRRNLINVPALLEKLNRETIGNE